MVYCSRKDMGGYAFMNQKLKDFLLLNLGTLLVAAGVYFFKFPNHFSTGGVSGLSILLGEMVPWMSSGAFVMVLNALMLALGFFFVNGSFSWSAYAPWTRP